MAQSSLDLTPDLLYISPAEYLGYLHLSHQLYAVPDLVRILSSSMLLVSSGSRIMEGEC